MSIMPKILFGIVFVFSSFAHSLMGASPWVTLKEAEQNNQLKATATELDTLLAKRSYYQWQTNVDQYLAPYGNSPTEKEAFKNCLRYLKKSFLSYASPLAAHLLINNYYNKKRLAGHLTQDEAREAIELIVAELIILTAKLYVYAQTEGLQDIYHTFQEKILAPLFSSYRSTWLPIILKHEIDFASAVGVLRDRSIKYDQLRTDFFMSKPQDVNQKHQSIKLKSSVDFYYNDIGLVFRDLAVLNDVPVNLRNVLITSKIDAKNTAFYPQAWPTYRIVRLISELGSWEAFFSYNFDFTQAKSYNTN